LEGQGHAVTYINARDERADIRVLLSSLHSAGVRKVHVADPTDYWIEKRLAAGPCTVQYHASPLFLNERKELVEYFERDLQRYHHNDFYIQQRKARGILIADDGKPEGGKWSFDSENRKKYPKQKPPPAIHFPNPDTYWSEAVHYVKEKFSANPGDLGAEKYYPTDHKGALQWLDDFLDQRFAEFGPFEDAIVASESILNHSVLTPMLNVGLITPQQIVDRTLTYVSENDIPINSTEGFLRQLIGWREFIRGVYQYKGREERITNFWGFKRKIPPSFYDGTTRIPPIDITIKKILKTGYCHHIERLMVLGNFMLLCEFDPDEVYRWFMELFIDSYDWVMVPNVYGMTQFADGGMMSTKPYISGSNYLMKMSDYPKGEWQAIWDGLFWRFMHVHRDFFSSSPRLGMLLRTWDKMPDEKRERHLENATGFLDTLNQ
jgi:deoxyribodipyrimidine photolyase-related protein